MNNFILIFFIFSLSVSFSVSACIARILPDKDFDKYQTIFIGEVTGVHLQEYQDMMVKGLREKNGYSVFTDTTLEYEVTVLPQRLKKGSVTETLKLKISGCGMLEPRVRQIGLFFIKPDGDVNVLYNGESFAYEDYLEDVGVYYRNKRERLKIQRGSISKPEQ